MGLTSCSPDNAAAQESVIIEDLSSCVPVLPVVHGRSETKDTGAGSSGSVAPRAAGP